MLWEYPERQGMLKRAIIWGAVIFFVLMALIYWWNIPVQPSTEGVASSSGLAIDQSAHVEFFERIQDGLDPEYVVLLVSNEDIGHKFCSENKQFMINRDGPADIFLEKRYSSMLRPDILCHVQVFEQTGHAFGVVWKNRILINVSKI
jgi:hypothetical protein